MKKRIDEWKRMESEGNPAANEYLKKITAEAKSEGKLDEMTEAVQYLMDKAENRLVNLEKSVADYTIHEQMGTLTEAVNLAYIARHYFGKTRQWLYQRLKGQMINGKPAQFTENEEETFIKALNEIGMQLVAFHPRL